MEREGYMIKQLQEATEQQLTERLEIAEDMYKQRLQMRGTSTLKSDQAWVEEAGINLYFIRQEIAARTARQG